MTLGERLSLGISLPHRSVTPVSAEDVCSVAHLAENLGFKDIWVTENTVGDNYCVDPVIALAYAAAVTQRIGLGVSVVVAAMHHPLHLAHQWATLDCLSNGRVTLGLGIGRDAHFDAFGINPDKRVRQFLDQVDALRALWRGKAWNAPAGSGTLARITQQPVQAGGPPLWFGGMHPASLRRAARYADGWMASGQSSTSQFPGLVALLRDELETAGKDPASFPISKRVFCLVDEHPALAFQGLQQWFGDIYGDASLAATAGIAGTPEHVTARLDELASMGLSHLVLNPVDRHREQTAVIAEICGLGSSADT